MKPPSAEEINKLPSALSIAAVAAHFGIPIDLVVSARGKAVKPFTPKRASESAPGMDSAHNAHCQMMRKGSKALLERTLALMAKRDAAMRRRKFRWTE